MKAFVATVVMKVEKTADSNDCQMASLVGP